MGVGQSRTVYYGGRSSNVRPPIPILLFSRPLPLTKREKEKGNFSIAEAARQGTGERENKSAPVRSLVTTHSKGLVQRERMKGVESVSKDLDYRGIMSFYCISL